MFWRHEQLSLQMMRAALEHHSRQVKATVGVQTVVVPELDALSEDSDVGDAGSRPHCLCEPQSLCRFGSTVGLRGVVSESSCTRASQD